MIDRLKKFISRLVPKTKYPPLFDTPYISYSEEDIVTVSRSLRLPPPDTDYLTQEERCIHFKRMFFGHISDSIMKERFYPQPDGSTIYEISIMAVKQ